MADPPHKSSLSSSIWPIPGIRSPTSHMPERLYSSFLGCNRHPRLGLGFVFQPPVPPFPPVSLVLSICVCFELGFVWSLSVQTGVRYVPLESNRSLFLLLISGRIFGPGHTTKQCHGCSPPHGSWDASNSVSCAIPGKSAAIDREGGSSDGILVTIGDSC